MEQENKVDKVEVAVVENTEVVKPVVINIAEALKEVEKQKEEMYTYDDIFVTESDTFDVEVKYYKDGKNLIVEGIGETFDEKRTDIKLFSVKFKYPSQRDQEIIIGTSNAKSLSNMDVLDLIQLELVRINTLIRSWTIKKELNSIVQMDPKIIKAICNKVRDELGMRGII